MTDHLENSPQHVSQLRLISPHYSFERFCFQMIGKDLMAVIEAAGAERAYAIGIHRHTTKESHFRKGSRGWEYSENLLRLVRILMNGSIPMDATPNFLSAAKPLLADLLRK